MLAFVVGAVVFGFGGYLVGRPSEEAQMAADIRAADAARDKAQIESLTDLARDDPRRPGARRGGAGDAGR